MRDRANSMIVFASLVMTIVIVVVYSIFLFRRDVSQETRIAILENNERENRRNIQLDNDVQNKRLTALESQLPVDLKESHDEILRRLAALETSQWRRNRDQQIRARLAALEAWRLRTEVK